jgi:NAD(P)-dependent dehydrogenase (short-subunit alcohol dehydrogenase family)
MKHARRSTLLNAYCSIVSHRFFSLAYGTAVISFCLHCHQRGFAVSPVRRYFREPEKLMDIRGKVAVVTGGASGIGAGLAKRFAAEGARGVVVADVNFERAQGVANEIGALAVRCDVSREADIQALVAATRERFGQVDIFMSNAGILGRRGGIELEDVLWDKMWQVHGMAHVWAARAVVPEMVARGEGYFVVTASAAGLLNIVESAPYGVTKHAAVAFAEWLRIAYGKRGVRVSCLCPQSVQTDMTANGTGSAGLDGVLTAEQVAGDVVATMREEKFLVLPHPEVAKYFQNKAQDYDRWLGGMQKLYAEHAAAKV